MQQITKKNSIPNILLAILVILPIVLLLVQIKINKTNPLNIENITIEEAYTQPSYVTTKNRKQMLHPVVKLSILDYNASLSGIQSSEGVLTSTATGVSVGYNRRQGITYILTNYHFCQEIIEEPFKVIIIEDSSVPRINGPYQDSTIGAVIKTSPELDLCLLSAAEYVRPARLAKKNIRINAFDQIYVIGAPTGIFPTIIDTYVSGFLPRPEVYLPNLSNSSDGNDFLFLSGIILPGHSGSPVYNKNNELVGLIFATLPPYGALAISIKDIDEFLNN